MRQWDKESAKTLTELTVEKNCILIDLSQNDTLALDPGMVYMQVRGLTAAGSAFATGIASLKGEKGDKGEDGKQGPEGPPGKKGDPGETPTIQNATQTQAGLMSADDKKSLDREFFRMLPKGGTAITTEGTDIDSIEFTKVGNYYCSLDLTASTFKNTPTKRSFMMFVLSPLSQVYDNEETTQWCYRLRIMVTYTGEFFVQSCSSGSEAGKFDFGRWKKFILEEV